MTDLRAELEDLDMEGDDGGVGGFVPLRDDAVQCFREHDGKASWDHVWIWGSSGENDPTKIFNHRKNW